MGVNLPNAGNAFIPEVPMSIARENPILADYLRSFKRAVDGIVRDQFSNNLVIATAMNLGTSGTFTLSSGGSIVVTSGIVIRVTS